MSRRRTIGLSLLAVAAIAAAVLLLRRPFPADTTPEGAYMRVARAVVDDRVEDAFPYLEEDARWASYTVRDMRAKAYDRVEASYPEPERTRLLDEWRADAKSADGADVFARDARQRGWVTRLRKDLSGAVSVEVVGERATVVTARGTRYSFRRRKNGLWGLTLFTAELVADAEKASRDLAVIEAAAGDYDRAKKGQSGGKPDPTRPKTEHDGG